MPSPGVLFAVAGMASAVAACTTLPPLGTCGNGVAEPSIGEDCDRDEPGCSPTCRLTCLEDDTCADPGHVCGVDGVCRRGAGLLYVADTTRMDTPLIAIADVDGDGIGDLVGGGDGDLDVVYGAPVGAPLERSLHAGLPESYEPDDRSSAFGIAPGEIAVATPIEDGVALVTVAGLEVSAPTLPLFDIGERELGGVAKAGPGFGAAVLSRTATDDIARIEATGDAGLIEPVVACAGAVPLGAGSYLRSKDIGGSPTQILIHPGGTTYCLRAYDGVGFGPPDDVPVPPAVEAAWPAQLDGDRCVEVVLDLPGFQIGLADAAEADGCAHDTWSVIVWAGGQHVAGIDDFDGDGRDELILSSLDGTLVTGGANEVQTRREITIGVAADVNRDGRMDLVAGSAAEPDLTVMLALADGTFASQRVSTTFPVTWLAAGDVDADTYTDVCTSGPHPVTGASQIEVHYGSASGLLDGQIVAAVPDMRGIAFGRMAGADSFDDLLVAQAGALNQFAGTGRRSPYAPIRIPFATGGISVIGGELVAGSGSPADLAVFVVVESTTIGAYSVGTWWLTDLGVPLPVEIVPSITADTPFPSLVVAAGTEDGHAIVFAARRHIHRELSGEAAPVVLLAARAAQDPALTVTSTVQNDVIPLPPGEAQRTVRLRPFQLDGDPESEVAVVLDETSGLDVRRRVVIVDRGAGARPPISLAELVGATECHDVAIAVLAGVPTLAVACTGAPDGDGVFVIADLEDPATVSRVATFELAFVDPTLEAGDVNGDRIDDLVVRNGAAGVGQVHTIVQCSTSTADPCPVR